MAKLFERSPRNMRIASWTMALALAGAWYQYDKKKAREFSDKELNNWNDAVLRMHPQKNKKPSRKSKEE
ncbi:hypothetical protein BBO99_00002280 [Phytophthora kernoviae]|uniref:Uncharacterized protein n=2 Tax=Phytophthora kernoviae TaxID=325452 RepID=A0A3R7HZY9_9STRA|nr:hypothetical protein G195_002697 [Phytophthora kernoviae 00238/432]KAG2528671.1 hypothetical protein JM16_002586 [Phytophthora kernoviae]KAG2530482.1 hypothetical protein JM18_002104 [Phytophthora kernoviae]RLN10664.1 hypothetical protein BBI17_002187 [Phytophthora kernoviae]RLN83283.1 hypothetical protein BBO99_00002280 [Phytophthora kernoviae]